MSAKAYFDRQGDRLKVEAGGSIDLAGGAAITVDGAQLAAMTAQLTTLTPADAAGTPDYAIAAVTNSSAFGFSNAAEAITILYVIRNLQVRVLELEARLKSLTVLPT